MPGSGGNLGNVTEFLQEAIIKLCNEAVLGKAHSIDGLVCISLGPGKMPVIVKLRKEKLPPNVKKVDDEANSREDDPDPVQIAHDGSIEFEGLSALPPVPTSTKRPATEDPQPDSEANPSKKTRLEIDTECEFCYTTFDYFEDLRDHHLEEHRLYTCRDCMQTFFEEAKLKEHIDSKLCVDKQETATPSNPLYKYSKYKKKKKYCGICKMGLWSLIKMKDHLSKFHSLQNLYSCVPCMAYFPSQKSFIKHRQADHPEDKDVRCNDCDVSFYYNEFNVHKKQCLSSVCVREGAEGEVAEVEERQEEVAEEAVVSESKEETLTIVVNEKGEVIGSSVDASANIAMAEAMLPGANTPVVFSCPNCDGIFSAFSEYSNHQFIHHNRVACELCYQTFTNTHNLKRHKARHVADKRFLCNHCGKRYARKSDWKVHMELKHGGVNAEDIAQQSQ